MVSYIGRPTVTALTVLLFLAATETLTSVARSQDVARSSEESVSEESVEEKKQRVSAERFLQLLVRRPRLGTAMDKVYGYHVSRGSLDDFCAKLATDAAANDDGKAWLVLGMVQMQRGQDAFAATSLEKAEQLLPDEPLPSYYLGKTLILLGEIDDAISALRRAVERKPARSDMLAIFQDLGRVYQRTGQNEAALKVWTELESLFPNDAQVQEEIATVLADEGADAAALERYTRLSKTLKDRFRRIEMAIRAAQMKAKLGKTEEALADFEAQLSKINPDSWLHRDVRRRIEEMFWSTDDVDGLVNYYTRWVKTHPEDVDAMMRTARVLSVQQRLPEAEKWFRNAIEKAPSKPEIRMALVAALVTDDRYNEAATEMKQVVELQPDNPDYVVRWGELVFNDSTRTEEQRRAECADIWRGLLRNRQDDPVTVARLADLLRGSESVDAALQQYRKAIELAPNEPQYREYLGEYLHQLNRKEEALKVWNEMAEGPRRTRDNLVRLSEVFSTFRYPEQAIASIAKACELKPTFGHRTRYAELLRKAGRNDEAMQQLDLAEPLADDPELRELVLDERIKNYQASGKLSERIGEVETSVATDQADDATAWRLLALLRDADRRLQPACEAIDKATTLDAGNPLMWETAATLQERSGRFGDAVKSYRRLATLDRRFLSNYLTQIASLEMRLGNVDAAIKAGEQLLDAASGNSQHFRFFAGICFQLGNQDRGFDVLRRSVRANPNDSDAIIHLAKSLSKQFLTDEAIELYWRAFGLAKDLDSQTAVITSLTELYLRTNRFESFVERLEMKGRERNNQREGILWSAAAHQAAGDFGMAKTMLEQLARQDSRDTKLLEQLVKLSRSEFDFESAAEYQKRLVAAAPTPENEYQLASILLELGEIDQAQTLWMRLAQRKDDPNAVIGTVASLMGKDEFETAVTLIEKSLQTQPNNWELLTLAMISHTRLDQKDKALEAARRTLALSVDPAEPSVKVKQLIQRRSTRGAATQMGYDPYADLGKPTRYTRVANEINSTLNPSANRFYGRRGSVFQPSCFLDAQATAYLVDVYSAEQPSEFVEKLVGQALEGTDRNLLWRAVMSQMAIDPNAARLQNGGTKFEKCIKALTKLGDPTAATQQASHLLNQRRSVSLRGETSPEPLAEERLDELREFLEIASQSNDPYSRASHLKIQFAGELLRSGKTDEAKATIDECTAQAKTSQFASSVLMQAATVLLSVNGYEHPHEFAINEARVLASNAIREMKTGSNARMNGPTFGLVIGQLAKHDDLNNSIQLLDEVLKWQAAQTTALRPSQREKLSNGGRPLTLGRVVNGNYVQTTITFPPASGYFSEAPIHCLYAIHDACKEDPQKLQLLREQVENTLADVADDPYLTLTRQFARASLAYWSEDWQSASDVLAASSELQIGSQIIGLARTRLLFESGRASEALEVLAKLRPSNQRMLVDRELAILQLLLQLGDLERAKQSAQKLFALRLNSDTELKLADLMYQLGMQELGERMMGRIRRRAGGKQQTLVQLMTRYAAANNEDAAAEMARQIIRRTSPRTSRSYSTAENQYHAQAVAVLAQVKQLDPLIERYEQLVERSPKSLKLMQQLVSFYEAAGRRQDATQLQLKMADGTSRSPQSLMAAGTQLAQARQYDKAVEKFNAAIAAQPDLFEQSFYEMETSYNEAKAWGSLVDTMIKKGVGKFVTSYRMGSLSRRLMQEKDHDSADRLLLAGIKAVPIGDIAELMNGLSRAEYQPGKEVIAALEEQLTDIEAPLASGRSNFVYSRSANGRASGFVSSLAGMVSIDEPLQSRVVKSMEARLEKDEANLVARILLAHLKIKQEEFDTIQELMAPVTAVEKESSTEAEAIWSVASSLAHDAKQPALACALLEEVHDDSFQDRSSDFKYSQRALLAFAYGEAGRTAEARRILVDQIEKTKIDESQNQYNPGYGEYRFLQSLSSISQRLVELNLPIEAYLAYRKAFADDTYIEASRRWGSDLTREKDRLKKSIDDITTPTVITKIVVKCLRPTLTTEASTDEAVVNPASESSDTVDDSTDQTEIQFVSELTKPRIEQTTLFNTRVTTLLEDFATHIESNESLRVAVKKQLELSPVPENLMPESIHPLAARLLLSQAVDDADLVQSTSQAIFDWAVQYPPAESDGDSDSDSDSAPTADQPNNAELLLAMAAVRIPVDTLRRDQVVTMLERAVRAAELTGSGALVNSLNCRIATHVADTEPDRARAIFRETLDKVLPPENKPAESKETPS